VRERDLDRHHHSHAYAHAHLAGLYRDEGVLPSLQVLAYLSKYPHMRQALYKRRNGFHLVSALAVAAAKAAPAVVSPVAPPAPELPEPESESEEEDWTDDEYDPPPGAPTDIQIVRQLERGLPRYNLVLGADGGWMADVKHDRHLEIMQAIKAYREAYVQVA
jgi:hypothetical protein